MREKNAVLAAGSVKDARTMLACWLYSSVPTPTPNTTITASQRSSGSRTISFRPSSTLPPIGCSPETSCCSRSRSTAQ